MTILWEYDEKHQKQVSAYGAQPLPTPYYEGHPSRPKTWWEIKTANARRADVFLQNFHKIVILSGAPHRLIA